jgi:hypothetical protein
MDCPLSALKGASRFSGRLASKKRPQIGSVRRIAHDDIRGAIQSIRQRINTILLKAKRPLTEYQNFPNQNLNYHCEHRG